MQFPEAWFDFCFSTGMKFYLLLLLLISLACRNASSDENSHQTSNNSSQDSLSDRMSHSMKGFELYVWETKGEIYYSLLRGTNRLKSYDEIHNSKVVVNDLKSIKQKIDSISPGETIIIKYENIDTSKVQALKNYIRSRNLEVYN